MAYWQFFWYYSQTKSFWQHISIFWTYQDTCNCFSFDLPGPSRQFSSLCLRSRTLLSHFFSQKWCFVFECLLSLLGTIFSQPFRLTASDISGKAEAIKPVAFAILPHIHFPSLLEAMGRLHWCLHVLFCDLFSLLLTFSLSIRAFDVLCHLIPSGCCV